MLHCAEMKGLKMKTRFIDIECKYVGSDDEPGLIEGYGSIFGNKDAYGDIVAPGAFTRSLQTKKPVMLWQHNHDQPIGVWDHVEEDVVGLRLRGKILINTQHGRDAYELAKAGAVTGLSIGYRPVREHRDGDANILDEVDLWETSIVTFPANDQARLLSVRANAMDGETPPLKVIEKVLRDAGLSRSESTRVVSVVKNTTKDERKMEDTKQILDALSTLQNELTEMKRDGARQEEKDAVEIKMNQLHVELDQVRTELEAVKNMPVGEPIAPELPDTKNAFLEHFIKRDDPRALEAKAINLGTGAEGAYLVPEELNNAIYDLLRNVSPMRGLCRVVNVRSDNPEFVVNVHGAAVSWVGETDARSETTQPALAKVAPAMGETQALIYSTQRALDDAELADIEAWLTKEVADAMADYESAGFVTGNGSNKPKGFLDYTKATTDDGTRSFGQVQYVATGQDGAFIAASTTTSPADTLLQVIYKMKPAHRRNCVWLMNSATLATVRQWKGTDGGFLWQAGAQSGQPDRLLGYPVYEVHEMPDIDTDAYPIAFGDFARGYTIADRRGISMLRDPYTNKPYVGFYATKRVGGGLIDSNAIKLIKTGTS